MFEMSDYTGGNDDDDAIVILLITIASDVNNGSPI